MNAMCDLSGSRLEMVRLEGEIEEREQIMNVKELIETLGEYPAEMRVVVQGYEDGYDDLSLEQLSKVKIALNIGQQRWEGTHGDPSGKRADGRKVVEALVLSRNSW